VFALLAVLGFVAAAPKASAQQVEPDQMQALRDELEQNGTVDVVVMFDIDQAATQLGGPASRQRQLSAEGGAVLARTGLRSELVAAELELEEVLAFTSVPASVLTVQSVEQLEALLASSLVDSVTLDDDGGTILTDGTREIIGADISWAGGLRGSGVRVAVLDTGIDTDHPDLASSVVHEACFVSNVDGTPGCSNGLSVFVGPGSAEDDNGHGTFVTGIIASGGDVAPRGVAPDVEIESIKMIDSAGIFSSSSQLTQALDYVLSSRPDVDVVNISAGTARQFTGACDSTFPAMSAAVAGLRARGIVVVSAATNSGDSTMGAPACLADVIAVGATFDNPAYLTFDTYASFASISKMTDVAAPGSTIDSTSIGGGVGAEGFGTSLATAAVTGCIAIFINQNYTTFDQINDRILTSNHLVGRNGFLIPRIDCSPVPVVGRAGDIDCDGRANDSDVAAVLDFLVGMRTDGGACPIANRSAELNLSQADANNDTSVRLIDALLLAQR